MSDLHPIFIAMGGTAVLGKIFLMMARTMPPPPEDCKFWCRWFHDFVQEMAENQDKVGKSQDPDKPVGQAKQTVAVSGTVAEVTPSVIATSVPTPTVTPPPAAP